MRYVVALDRLNEAPCHAVDGLRTCVVTGCKPICRAVILPKSVPIRSKFSFQSDKGILIEDIAFLDSQIIAILKQA